MSIPWPNVCQMMLTGANKLQMGLDPDEDHARHFYKIIQANTEAGIWALANGQKISATNKCELYPAIKAPSTDANGNKTEVTLSEWANLFDCYRNNGNTNRPGGIYINGKKYLSKL